MYKNIYIYIFDRKIIDNIPKCKIPINKHAQPEMNVKRTAKSGPKSDFCNVSLVKIAIIAVGPTGTSLQDPKIVYTKHAMKDEYKPYCEKKENFRTNNVKTNKQY